MKCRLILVTLVAAILASGCISPKGATMSQKRDFALKMRDAAVSDLSAKHAGLQSHMKSAAGYAVFDNGAGKLGFFGIGNGYGVLHDNATGKDTYLKMFHVSVGPGIGYKRFRGIYVIDDKSSLLDFGSSWRLIAEADAVAKSSKSGGEVGAAGDAADNVEYYQVTKAGLIIEAALVPRKNWKDKDLD